MWWLKKGNGKFHHKKHYVDLKWATVKRWKKTIVDMKENSINQFYLIVFLQVCFWEGVVLCEKCDCGEADTVYKV